MNRFRVEIVITPRPGLLDPQGKAIQHALAALGRDAVQEVRCGKAIFLDLQASSADAARDQVRDMCRKLLANPVTEDFEIRAAEPAEAEVEAARTPNVQEAP